MDERKEIVIEEVLKSCYGTSNRKYHTWKHIQDMLDKFDNLFKQDPDLTNKIGSYQAFRDAVKFHDVIYFVDNCEVLSAELAEMLLADKWHEDVIKYIQGLIHATDYSKDVDIDLLEFDQQLMRDLDLSGLGADPITYKLNGFAVRQEYECPQGTWAKGRVAFLRKMLALPCIYCTEYFKQYEKQARENMETELKLYGTKE